MKEKRVPGHEPAWRVVPGKGAGGVIFLWPRDGNFRYDSFQTPGEGSRTVKYWMTFRVSVAILTGIVVGILTWMMPPIPRKTFVLGVPKDASFVIRTISSDGRFVFGDAGDLSDAMVWDLDGDFQKPWIECGFPADPHNVEVTPFSPDERTFLCVSLSNEAIHYRTFDLQTGRVKSEGNLANNGQGFPFFAGDGRLVNRRQDVDDDLLLDLESGKKVGHITGKRCFI